MMVGRPVDHPVSRCSIDNCSPDPVLSRFAQDIGHVGGRESNYPWTNLRVSYHHNMISLRAVQPQHCTESRERRPYLVRYSCWRCYDSYLRHQQADQELPTVPTIYNICKERLCSPIGPDPKHLCGWTDLVPTPTGCRRPFGVGIRCTLYPPSSIRSRGDDANDLAAEVHMFSRVPA
jgi:hypothetical protein